MHETISIRGAADTLSVGRTTIYKLIGDGTLQTIKIGRRRLILTRSIHQLCGPPASSAHTTDSGQSPPKRQH